MARLGSEYREASKRNAPKEWFDAELPHTRQALDDAIEQGAPFRNVLAARRPSILLRRRPGRRGDLPVHHGEREIIARN